MRLAAFASALLIATGLYAALQSPAPAESPVVAEKHVSLPAPPIAIVHGGQPFLNERPPPAKLPLNPKEKCLPYDMPIEIAAAVLNDLHAMPADCWPFVRYVWVPDGSDIAVASTRLSYNLSVSRSANFVKPYVFYKRRLLRYDARFAGGKNKAKDVGEILSIWENFENDPSFHTTIEIEEVDKDGKVKVKQKTNIAIHLAASEIFQEIVKATGSNAPIVRYDLFIVRALSTEDLGFGSGLYYDFREIKTDPKKNDFAEYLKTMGLDIRHIRDENVKDLEVIMKSRVTGKHRKVFFVTAADFRPSQIDPVVTWTEDLSKDQTKIGNDAFRNVRVWEFAAIESIGFCPNGLPEFSLFNAAGVRQNAAPGNVVSDYRIPQGNDMELQGAISCLRCHVPEGRGWQNLDPTLSRILGGRKQVNLLDDLTGKEKFATVDEIASELGNNTNKPLARLREDFGELAFLASGGTQLDEVVQHLTKIFEVYVYAGVDQQMALQECGFSVTKEESKAAFNILLPPIKPGKGDNYSPQDIVIEALRKGETVQRWQFNTIQSDLILRTMQSAIMPPGHNIHPAFKPLPLQFGPLQKTERRTSPFRLPQPATKQP